MALIKWAVIVIAALLIVYKYPKLLTLILIIFGVIILIRFLADMYWRGKDKGMF